MDKRKGSQGIRGCIIDMESNYPVLACVSITNRTIDADIPDVVTLADWAYKHVKESMKKEQEGEVLENDHEKEASEVE